MDRIAFITTYLKFVKHEGNRQGGLKLLDEITSDSELANAPGSSHNHQAWPGGYLDHVVNTMQIAEELYGPLAEIGPLPFSLGSVILIMFLHDLEKPWRHVARQTEEGKRNVLMRLAGGNKESRKVFRELKIDLAGITLSDDEANALKYVEGELDDYRSDQRIMGPLAAFCHMCDVASARIFHNLREV